MKSLKGVCWLVIKSSPLSRNVLLKNILANRFPSIKFEYLRFHSTLFQRLAKNKGFDGVIAELKNLSEKNLPLFDRLLKKFQNSEVIFILSPKAYQVLNQKRKKSLHRSFFLLSELKSLDYLTTLPRLVEEVALRKRLKHENELLQKLFKQNWEGPIPEEFEEPEALQETPKQGIRLVIRNWNQLTRSFNEIAELECSQMISRSLASTVRGSDRVLRSKDNEYLILLENVDARQLRQCVTRLSRSLEKMQIRANSKPMNLNFALESISERP